MPILPVEELENQLGHTFIDQDLIRDALTHSSAGKERDYERLEFLGDRVLGLIVAQILFAKFPTESEGDLAKRFSALVQGSFLAQISRKIDLGSYTTFSSSERQAGGADNDNILADVFEAVIGALYLDAGLEKCRVLVEQLWADSFFEMQAPPQHPKTKLQEWAQSKGLPLPSYIILRQSGPDHLPVFDVELTLEGHEKVVAQGNSRQAAEKEAAEIFLRGMETDK